MKSTSSSSLNLPVKGDASAHFNENDLVTHGLITGATGSGKTTLLEILADRQIRSGRGGVLMTYGSESVYRLIQTARQADRLDDLHYFSVSEPEWPDRSFFRELVDSEDFLVINGDDNFDFPNVESFSPLFDELQTWVGLGTEGSVPDRPFLFLVDDYPKTFSGESEATLRTVLSQGRLNTGIFLATESLGDVPEFIRANTNTKVVFRPDPDDVGLLGSVFFNPDPRSLAPGECLLRDSSGQNHHYILDDPLEDPVDSIPDSVFVRSA